MTGETLERVETADGGVYECYICGGRSATRMPNHNEGCLVLHEGDEAIVYNREAVIERAYETTVRVRFEDNGSTAYVVHDHVEVAG